jgi:exopolysaccharide biosynthesis polyprenyl glycosylphosphotransferase
MSSNEAGVGVPDGPLQFEPLAIKNSRFRLIDASNRSAGRAAIEIAEPWWDRRFAATREINDDDDVAPLAAVERSMRREQTSRRALATADGTSALAIACIAAAVWGASLSWLFLVVPALAILVAKVEGLYDRDDMVVSKSTVGEWRILLRAAALNTIGTYLVWLLSTDPPEGRGIRLFAFLLLGMFAFQVPTRVIARRVARARSTDERCLIVGSTQQCEKLAESLADIRGLELIGTVSDDDVDCSVAGVHELVEQLDVERIVVVPHPGWGERGPLKLIQSSKWLGVRISLMPTVMAVVGAAAAIDKVEDTVVLLGVPRFGLSRSSEALKRALDLAIASLMLLLTSPAFIVIAVAVKRDSTGPALFRQKRVGRNGTSFSMFKFRSMVDGAESMKARLDARNETSGLFKMSEDPRVTKVGKLLRRTYLDELPQLINVLRGEMSIVGPRPLIESEDSLLTGYDRHRSRLTPGMTGPWQLRGPLAASLPELAKLDYMYASNWSIWADVDIILSTVARVLTRRGR